MPDLLPQTDVQKDTIDELDDAADKLRNFMTTTTDLQLYSQAADEYTAVQNRISILLGLQIDDDTSGMTSSVKKMTDAKSQLDKTLADVTEISTLINDVATYLKAVDVLVTAAKVAAAAV